MRRYAIIQNTRHNRPMIERHLPENYKIVWYGEGHGDVDKDTLTVIIGGEDQNDLTLDGYVIPRLDAANIQAQEIDSHHPAMEFVFDHTLPILHGTS